MKKLIALIVIALGLGGAALIGPGVASAAPSGCTTRVQQYVVDRVCSGGTGQQQVLAGCTGPSGSFRIVKGNWASATVHSVAICATQEHASFAGYNTRP